MPKLILSVLVMSCFLIGPVSAYAFADNQLESLLAPLPGREKIPDAADALITSAGEISRAADQIKASPSCAMNRALIGLGAALQDASDVLKLLEPLVLPKTSPGLGALVKPKPTPAEAAAWQEFFHRRIDFRSALARLARAGQSLAALDPIGSTGPPTEAGPLIKNAGKSLVDLGDETGIGRHLDLAGSAVEAFRIAALAFDKTGCARFARLMGQTAELAGLTLRSADYTVWQSDAAKLVGGSLFDMSQHLPAPSFDSLVNALDLYAQAVVQRAQTERRQSEIASHLDALPEWPSITAYYRKAAPFVTRAAAQMEAVAPRISEVRTRLSGPVAGQKNLASLMRTGGAALENATPWFALQAAGKALTRAGDLLANGQTQAASQVLKDAFVEISRERSLILGSP